MKTLTASYRSSLIRLASTLPVGDTSRRVILSGLKMASTGQECEFLKANDGSYYMGLSDYPPEDDDGYWDDGIKNWWGPFPSFEAADGYLRRNFANPGGHTIDNSGSRPPPRNPIKPAHSFRGRFSSVYTSDATPSEPYR